MESAIGRRAVAARGTLQGRPQQELANFSDPAGNGVDPRLTKWRVIRSFRRAPTRFDTHSGAPP